MAYFILQQLNLRPEIPLWLKGASLLILFLFGFLYFIDASWLTGIRKLALTPLQRFGWKTDHLIGSWRFRIFSALMTAAIVSLLIVLYHQKVNGDPMALELKNWLLVLIFILIGFVLKFTIHEVALRILNRPLFAEQLIDFQTAFNALIALFLMPPMLLDMFVFRLFSSMGIWLFTFLSLFLVIRLWGIILLALKHFNYPLILLFIYLCALELMPLLVIAKVLLNN